jgi:hypothetical protein
MPKRISRPRAVVMLLLLVALPAGRAAAARRLDPEAAGLARFNERLHAYLSLRRQIEAKLPPLSKTANPAEIGEHERRLGAAIRDARPGARRGDIFGPDVSSLIRSIVREDFRRRPPGQVKAAVTEVPPTLGLRIDDPYPLTYPLATVPPQLLAALPHLPDGLEYRFVGRRVILRDVGANLVLDFIEDAVPTAQAR